jgi:prevent-host-death family protein
MSTQPEITQRDLRLRSREIMDAVEHGQAYTVTRDGRGIGELVPLRRRRRFVSREEIAALSRSAPSIDIEAFRADQDAFLDQDLSDPYERQAPILRSDPREHHDPAAVDRPCGASTDDPRGSAT